MHLKKIKAGALQYVIFISTVIALLLGAFVLLNYLQQKLRTQMSFFSEVVTATENSFDFIKTNDFEYDNEYTLGSPENEFLETKLRKKHWGMFDIVFSENKLKTENFGKIALLGGQNMDKPSLYLKEKNVLW